MESLGSGVRRGSQGATSGSNHLLTGNPIREGHINRIDKSSAFR